MSDPLLNRALAAEAKVKDLQAKIESFATDVETDSDTFLVKLAKKKYSLLLMCGAGLGTILVSFSVGYLLG